MPRRTKTRKQPLARSLQGARWLSILLLPPTLLMVSAVPARRLTLLEWANFGSILLALLAAVAVIAGYTRRARFGWYAGLLAGTLGIVLLALRLGSLVQALGTRAEPFARAAATLAGTVYVALLGIGVLSWAGREAVAAWPQRR